MPTPPKVSLSALEQELAKLHTNRRATSAAEITTTQQGQSPDSHVKTYSEVVQQHQQPQSQTENQEPPRVRKISRFAVSVVKEQQDAAAAAAAKHAAEMAQQPPQQTIAAQIAAQAPQVMQQNQPQVVQMVSQPQMVQNKPQLNLNLVVQTQTPIQIQQAQLETTSSLKPLGKHYFFCSFLIRFLHF